MKKLSELRATAFRSSILVPPRFKAGIKILIFFILLTSITSMMPQKAFAQPSVSFQVFYDELSPYGEWVDNPDYGYVWIPRVSDEFVPYGTNGYWVLTQDGWTWFSNYSWGWAPFHYGRWFYDSFYGWVWVPGNEWGPGWVVWRRSEGYYGWAPIGPGVGLDAAYGNSYVVPHDRWRFVRDRDFGRTDINNYYVSPSTYTEIINNSTVINNIQVDNSRNVRYNAGPAKTEVESRAGKTFTPVAIKESSTPTQSLKSNQLELFKPQVQKNTSVDRKAAPSKVASWNGSQQAKKQQEQQQSDQQAKKQQEQQQNDQQLKKQQEQQQNDQQLKKQQEQQQHDQQVKKQQEQQQSDQQAKKQQEQQQNDQQAKKQQEQQQNNQQLKKQQEQQQHDQQVKKQQEQQQHDQQVKKQQEQQQHDQQVKKQNEQQQSDQQTKEQHNNQPTKKQPAKQKTSQPQDDSTEKN
jgi:hypothetical protein